MPTDFYAYGDRPKRPSAHRPKVEVRWKAVIRMLPKSFLWMLLATTPGFGLDAAAAEQARGFNRTALVDAAEGLADKNPARRMKAGVALCLAARPTMARAADELADKGWPRAQWGGLSEFRRDGLRIVIADNGWFCDVSSMEVSTAQAERLAAALLHEAGVGDWRFRRTDRGCLEIDAPPKDVAALTLTVQSAGQDPVCPPHETSAVRIWAAQD